MELFKMASSTTPVFPSSSASGVNISDVLSGLIGGLYSAGMENSPAGTALGDGVQIFLNSLLSRYAVNKGWLSSSPIQIDVSKTPGSVKSEYLVAAILSLPQTYIAKEAFKKRSEGYLENFIKYPVTNFVGDLVASWMKDGDYSVV